MKRALSARRVVPRHPWGLAGLLVICAALAWILASHLRPSFDAFGWLDWGRQTIAGNLNTDAAPSWKPLTFLFTLPYGLLGHNPQMWLWMITSTAGALAGAVFAARIAYRLSGPTRPERRWARWIAAGFAAIGLLALSGYSKLVMQSNSDPMVATLCLAAADFALSGRRRLAFAAIVLASLGRPEAWLFAVLYAGWAWRAEPRMRWMLVLGCLAIPLAWFIVPALTSRSWLHPGTLALGSPRALHGNKIVGVFDRLRNLFAFPVQLTILFALALGALRRDRAWLGLGAAALLWALVEIAFAYHGWSAVYRYLIEAGGLLMVLAAAGVGRVLAWVPPGPRLLSLIPLLPVIALLVALIPGAHARARAVRHEILIDHRAALELSRLEAVIGADGGPGRIEPCGRPATLLGYQSELAWALGLNVGAVSANIGKSMRRGRPVVIFDPHDDGWIVRTANERGGTSKRCRVLVRDSQFGGVVVPS